MSLIRPNYHTLLKAQAVHECLGDDFYSILRLGLSFQLGRGLLVDNYTEPSSSRELLEANGYVAGIDFGIGLALYHPHFVSCRGIAYDSYSEEAWAEVEWTEAHLPAAVSRGYHDAQAVVSKAELAIKREALEQASLAAVFEGIPQKVVGWALKQFDPMREVRIIRRHVKFLRAHGVPEQAIQAALADPCFSAQLIRLARSVDSP